MAVRDIALTACGAVTPVGLSAPQTCASLRAGIHRLGEHGWYECLTPDPGWDPEDPLVAGSVPGLDPDQDGLDAHGIELPESDHYRWYNIKTNIWNISEEAVLKYPEYRLKEDQKLFEEGIFHSLLRH